ncbi:MAG: type II toxin-antitoxin system Phd/YefM family antitoxin [Spirochaetales bacterium]|nr:type II toxin-antitoxin system Phd/YefM family antitoxin [Spirochaetales bacterium]
MISISDVNKNFSNVTKTVEKYGYAIVMKNNAPKYIISEFNQVASEDYASNEELLKTSAKLIARNKAVYNELAK